MSWSVKFDSEDDLADSIPADNHSLPDARDQYYAGKAAALLMIASGTLGVGKQFIIHLSGHSNPGHEPAPGYAHDALTVSIYQR